MSDIEGIPYARAAYDLKKQECLMELATMDEAEFQQAVKLLNRRLLSIPNGLLCDPELDRVIAEHYHPSEPRTEARKVQRVVHVVSHLFQVGGHSRLLDEWITLDKRTVGLCVTGDSELKFSFEREVPNRCLGDLDIPASVDALVAFVKEMKADLLLIHHHPNDLIPLYAISQIPEVYTAIVDQADHKYWPGASLVDSVVCIRSEGVRAALDRRSASSSFLLAFPFEKKRGFKPWSSSVEMLAVISRYKVAPFGQQDFIGTLLSFLARNPQVQMHIVGLDEENWNELQEAKIPSNLTLHGIIPDLKPLFDRCHYLLDTFPLGGLLTCRDAAEQGVVPILGYGKKCHPLAVGFESVIPALDRGQAEWTAQRYLQFLDEEVQHGEYYRSASEQITEHIAKNDRTSWKERLEVFYAGVEKSGSVKEKKTEPAGAQDERWLRFNCDRVIEDFREVLLSLQYLTVKDFLRVLPLILRARKAGHYFPNNDIRGLLFRSMRRSK